MSRTSLYRVSLCRGLRYIGVRYTEDFVIQGFVTSRSYYTKFNLVSIKRGGGGMLLFNDQRHRNGKLQLTE